MQFSILMLVIAIAGSTCRWTAYAQRVAPPHRFSIRERGFWLPPWPEIGEFASPRAQKLEVIGRVLIDLAVSFVLVESILR
jgi:hypothetical protein